MAMLSSVHSGLVCPSSFHQASLKAASPSLSPRTRVSPSSSVRCCSSEPSTSTETNSGSGWAFFEDLLPSKEWTQNFAILNYEDLCQYYEPLVLKEQIQPSTFVANIMTEIRYSAQPEQSLGDINHFFDEVSGIPVIDEDYMCLGVLSKKDRAKAKHGVATQVCEIMSSPAITLFADKTVSDAAVLMLKNKIHRIPIVNSSNQVIGMVSRTDIFTALEGCVAE